MSASLPITFSALLDVFNNKKMASKLLIELEAWLNFETMKASWYGDESKMIKITLYLLSADKFNQLANGLDASIKRLVQQPNFVIYSKKSPLNITALFMSPTIEEQVLDKISIEQQLKQELLTMLNLIADEQGLPILRQG